MPDFFEFFRLNCSSCDSKTCFDARNGKTFDMFTISNAFMLKVSQISFKIESFGTQKRAKIGNFLRVNMNFLQKSEVSHNEVYSYSGWKKHIIFERYIPSCHQSSINVFGKNVRNSLSMICHEKGKKPRNERCGIFLILELI